MVTEEAVKPSTEVTEVPAEVPATSEAPETVVDPPPAAEKGKGVQCDSQSPEY